MYNDVYEAQKRAAARETAAALELAKLCEEVDAHETDPHREDKLPRPDYGMKGKTAQGYPRVAKHQNRPRESRGTDTLALAVMQIRTERRTKTK